MQKVIIDADPGIGDAVAIALAISDPDLDVVGITPAAGRVSGRDATRNVQAILEILDPPKRPRFGDCSLPLPNFPSTAAAGLASPVEMNGKSGLGDTEFKVAELHHRHESAKLMVDLVRTDPNEITLLTLGPLTNLELACERAPEFLSLLRGLVCLGGSIAAGGDITAAAEFNAYVDPEAARMVLLSPATKTLVPLDVSSRTLLTFEQWDRIQACSASPLGQFLGEVLPFAFRAHHQFLGMESVMLHEVVALAAVARPRLFQSRMMALDVETSGELTRGMTVFDRRGIRQWQTNIDVVQSVDSQGVLDYFTEVVRNASGR